MVSSHVSEAQSKVELRAMKGIAAACIAFLMTSAIGQTPTLHKPGITFVISEHATSSDAVEITVLDPDYPKDLLQAQCMKLGEILGSPPRGLDVEFKALSADDPKLRFLKSTFATDGIIDRQQGILHIEPILKAFAGAPEPYTLEYLTVIFVGERPNNNTVRAFREPGIVEASAKGSEAPAGIEYQIHLITQDPTKIVFPSSVPQQERPVENTRETRTNQTLIYVLIGVAAVSVGALVYLALLRSPGKKP